MRKAIFQVSLLSGTIIGAGVFALPFVFQTAGVWTGFFYLALGTLAFSVIHLLYADIVMRTKEQHRFLGYARMYLGRISFLPIFIMTIVEAVFVLAIYLVLSRSFSGLIGFSSGEAEAAMIFWFISSLSVFAGLRKIAFLEFFATGGIITIVLLVFFWGLNFLDKVNFGGFFENWGTLFLPLAPVLFSLSGRVAIPSLIGYSKDRISVKKSVILGTILPAVVYGLFVLSVLGLSGTVSEDSVSGLLGNVPSFIIVLISIFGLLAIWTSYIAVGFDIYQSLLQDLNFSRWLTPLVITFGPLLVYFFGSQDFLTLVGFTGGIFLALESILIIWMWFRMSRISSQPPLLINKKSGLILILISAAVFITALGYEVFKLIYT